MTSPTATQTIDRTLLWFVRIVGLVMLAVVLAVAGYVLAFVAFWLLIAIVVGSVATLVVRHHRTRR